MSILAAGAAVLISAIASSIGTWAVMRPEKEIEASKIQEARYDRPASALYALCLDAARSGKEAGQNVRDCDQLRNDTTLAGRIKAFNDCILVNRGTGEKEPKLDCKALVEGRLRLMPKGEKDQ